ncbi:MAG: OmpA family protein [Butyricimonas faecalis]
MKVDIRGYTDHTGTDRVNLPLSLKRAEALKVYLIGKHFDRSNEYVRRG